MRDSHFRFFNSTIRSLGWTLSMIGWLVLAVLPAGRIRADGLSPKEVRRSGRTRTSECTDTAPAYPPNNVAARNAACYMEKVRSKVEEWGLVTISAPVAIIDASKFSLGTDSEFPRFNEYLDRARTGVQASVSQFNETALQNQLGAVVTPLLPGTTTTTTTTTPPATPTPTPAPVPATANSLDPSTAPTPTFSSPSPLSTPNFSALGSLGATKPGSISERQALNIAAGDKMTANLQRVMTEENRIKGHNQIIFAVVEVSCNPGWRTKGNYMADCTAFVEYYDRVKDEAVPHCERRQPTIFSVLPLIDAQTIEAANGQRQMNQLAFDIAGAFPTQYANIKGRDILQFVSRYQKDSYSRTPKPVVNTYSTGRIMGFRFSPSFQALRDPAARKSGTANLLLPTTFPALVTIVLHDDDLKHIGINASTATRYCLMTHISTRWLLNDRPPAIAWYRRLVTPMARETSEQRVDMAEDVACMFHWYDVVEQAYENAGRHHFDPVREELRRDILELEAKGIGQSWPIPFSKALVEALNGRPSDKSSTVGGTHAVGLISPSELCDGETALLSLAGTGLDDVQSVSVAGTDAPVVGRGPGWLKIYVDQLKLSGTTQVLATLAAAATDAKARLDKTKTDAAAAITDGKTKLAAAMDKMGALFKSYATTTDNAKAALDAEQKAFGVASDANYAILHAATQPGDPAIPGDLTSNWSRAIVKLESARSMMNTALDAYVKANPSPDAQADVLKFGETLLALDEYKTSATALALKWQADAVAADRAQAALKANPDGGDIPVVLVLKSGSVTTITGRLRLRTTACPAAAAAHAMSTPPPTNAEPAGTENIALWPGGPHPAPAAADRVALDSQRRAGSPDDLPSP